MNETGMEHRLTEVESRSKSNTHRIDKLERVTEEIHTMSNTMIQLVEEVKHTNETVSSLDQKVEKMDSRVDDMERAPGKEWSNAKRTVFNTIVSGLIGAITTGLIWAAVRASQMF